MLAKERIFFKDIKTIKLEELEYTNIFTEPEKKKSSSSNNANSKSNVNPIVIDYGSYCTKAGWGNYEYPSLVFRSIVSKNKDLKNADGIVYVGNKLKDFDYSKNNYKSPFEKNVIQHFGLLENLNDYIFSELNINESKINHPIIATECIANPDYCRSKFMEQMFECYQIPSLVLGVDALFSLSCNSISKESSGNSLIISLGNMTSHVIPIINGEVQMRDIKRVNVGGFHSFDVLYKHMNLKYPGFKSKLTQNYIQAVMENLTFSAINYKDQLKYFRYGVKGFEKGLYKNKIEYENYMQMDGNLEKILQEPINLEFPFNFEKSTTVEEQNRKQDLRKEQAQRLRETMARRKQEKEQTHREELKELTEAEENIEKDETKADEILKRLDFESKDELKKRIKKLKEKLGMVVKLPDEEKLNLINIPDDQLTAEQQRQKRYQLMQKQAAITRKLKKEMESKKKEELNKLKEENPEVYIADLYEKRKKLLDLIEEKKKLRTEFSGYRNSRGNQKRLQTYVQLGESQKDKKGNVIDDFGLNEDDWAIYKTVSKEPVNDEDEEGYVAKLADIDKELQKLDPNFEEMTKGPEEEIPELFPQNSNTVELTVDMIRGPECFFQPSLVGVDQMGLVETIELVLKNKDYSDSIKSSLLENIYITGGPAFTKNFIERLKEDLKSVSPVGTKINIKIAKDPIFDSWKGMQIFSKKKENITKYGISKAEYEEKGAFYFKKNPFSNVYS